MLTVQKFGGSSLADAARIRRAAGIIAEEKAAGNEVVAVLSAMGDSTDELIEKSFELCAQPPMRELDALLSTGELVSAALMAMQLNALGVPAVSLSGRQAGIITDENHGNAKILSIKTRRIREELGVGRVVIVAGFQGISGGDNISTLGRGGSDTTAVALAAALKADKCEIYSDVDGIYTADPRLATGAKKLDTIDYEDMLHLALGGSQVLHSRAVKLAREQGLEVRLKSSFVKNEGTRLMHFLDRPPLCGVTRDRGENRISLVGKDANLHRLCAAARLLTENGIPIISAEAQAGVCSLITEPRFVLPALQLIHRHFFDG